MTESTTWRKCALPLPLLCLLGCAAFQSPESAKNTPPDPLVEEILKKQTPNSNWSIDDARAETILREVPEKTALAQARATMERHGFTCWAGVPDGDSWNTCLYCTAYKQKTDRIADKIIVKLFYQNDRVTRAAVSVENNVIHSNRGFWPVL